MNKSSIQKQRWSTRKKIFVAIGVLVVILAVVYIIIATEKYAGTKSIKEDYTVDAISFIREFRNNDSLANAKYSEKIIVVNGTVSSLESPDTASVNIKFTDPESGDYVIFQFQEQYLQEAKTVSVGDSIAVKGSSSGSSFSRILDAYTVPFKRATLHKNYSRPSTAQSNP